MPNLTNTELLPVKRKFVCLNELNIFYLDTETDGPLLLCLHGRFGRGETWLELMDRYADRFRVIAPDQRGHGLSDKPQTKYTSEEMAQDAASLLELIDHGPALVIGHSMGGRIAGYLSALHSNLVSGLVILDQTAKGPEVASSLKLEHLPPKDNFTADWPLPFSSYRHARDFLLQRTQSEIRTSYYMDSLVERIDGYHMLFSQQATSAIFEYQEDWFHLLPQISHPVLLVRAKNSEELSKSDSERMQSMLQNSSAV